jgi:hypothetical protein
MAHIAKPALLPVAFAIEPCAVEQSLGIPGVHRSRTDVATPPR